MHVIAELFIALWDQNFEVLSNPDVTGLIYLIIGIILILENGVLPAAFLPGDSLLFLIGILIAKGSLNFPLTIVILTICASIGYWLGYLEGKWLGKTQLIQRWMKKLPTKYHDKANTLLDKHGSLALLIARFIAFVRTLIPILVGLSDMPPRRFHFANILSGFLWVFIVVGVGYLFSHTSVFQHHQDKIITLFTLLPFILIIIGFVSSLVVISHKKLKQRKK